MSHFRTSVLLLITVLCSPLASWAGKEFQPGPGETIRPDQLIIKLKPGASIGTILSAVAPQASAIAALSSHSNLHLLQLPPGLQQLLSKALAAHPLVEFVEPNHVRSLNVSTPNDPSYSSQWALQTIQAVQAWSLLPDRYLTSATAGTGRIKVAILDTGADCTHPEFKNNGGTSTDSAQGGQLLFASSQALIPTTIATPACPWQDDHGHGTHVAGTVAAATQNGTGVASTAYPLQLIIFKVLDNKGSGPDSTIAQAIELAADAGAQVISLSLGGAGYSQALQDAVNYAWKRNTLVVAAAGNSNSNQLFFPAGANYAMGVAATDSANAKASFSNFGPSVDIAAPGVSILSTAPTYANSLGSTSYATLSGTSMATPHVSAVAGLVALENLGLSAAAIAQRLQRSAQSANAGGGWDQNKGYGILNAFQAVSGTLRTASVGGIVGQVVDSSNIPVTGANVFAGGASMSTAADGLFRISNLTAGPYTLTVTATGFSGVTMQVTVVAGADTTATVPMGVPLGAFTGTVKNNGTPVAGAVVEGLSGGLIQGTAVTDANGSYTLTLPAGTYSLTASAVGDINNTVTAPALAANTTAIVNLTIQQLGNVTGVVKTPAGSPIAGAHVNVANSSSSVGATTDGNGNFSTLGVPPGTYTVTASATGYSDLVVNGVSVSPNASTQVVLQFPGSAPVVSAVSINPITTSTATISWNTDVPADSQVAYGTTASYGAMTTLAPALVTSHSVDVTGLTAATTYHFQVLSHNSSGTLGSSPDLTFTTAAAAPVQLISSVGALGSVNSTYTDYAGMQLQMGTTSQTVAQLGFWCQSGDSTSHLVKLTSAISGNPDLFAPVSIQCDGVAGFHYGNAPDGIVLAANTTYYLLAKGAPFYNRTAVTPTSIATIPRAVSVSQTTYYPESTPNVTYGPLDMKVSGSPPPPPPPSNALISSVGGLGSVNSTYTDYAGVQLQMGSSSQTVTQLGFWCQSGDSTSHLVKLTSSDSGNPDLFAPVSVQCDGAAGFHYVNAPAGIVLTANTTYYLLAKGTPFYNSTSVLPTSIATIPRAVSVSQTTYYPESTPNMTYGPLDLKVGTSPPPPPPPPNTLVSSVGALGSVNSTYTDYAGMQLQMSTASQTISQVGFWCQSGDNTNHLVKITSDAAGHPDLFAAVSVTCDGVAGFHYANVPAGITLAANTLYYLLAKGTPFYNRTSVVPTSIATIPRAVSVSQTTYYPESTPNVTYGPLDLRM